MTIKQEKERACLQKTINTFRKIDEINLERAVTNEGTALILNKTQMIMEMINEFDIGMFKGEEIFNEAKKFNEEPHNNSLKQEFTFLTKENETHI